MVGSWSVQVASAPLPLCNSQHGVLVGSGCGQVLAEGKRL